MRTVITALIISCGPLASAAFAGKTFGDFEVGKKFTFKVAKLEINKDRGSAFPSEVPKLKIGQSINFVIGAKGALKGPGFSMPFYLEQGNRNFYMWSSGGRTAMNADVIKGPTGKPMGVGLSFIKTTTSPVGNTGGYVVVYILK